MIFYLNENEKVIGTIDFSECINEAVGKVDLDSLGKCDVVVRGNEGTVPHVHIVPLNKDAKVKNKKGHDNEVCVHLESNYFFAHTSHPNTLNRKECEILDEWFRELRKDKEISNWEEAVENWFERNSGCINNSKLSELKEQPDYSTMKEISTRYEEVKDENK